MAALGLASVAVLVAGQGYSLARGDRVEARSFVLVDENSIPRAVLGFTSERAPVLYLADEKGAVRASFSLSKDGLPAIEMKDANEAPRARLRVTESGSTLYLSDPQKKVTAVLDVLEGKGPHFWLSDTASKIRVGMGVVDDTAGVMLADQTEKERLLLQVAANGDTEITTVDQNTHPRVTLRGNETGTTNFQFRDAGGKVQFRAP
jgi:hypothetical protein